jgi:hypothetical protein
MNGDKENWLTIIPPLPEREFEEALKGWSEENRLVLAEIPPDRFAIDVLRTKDGKSHRRLRMKLL